MHEQPGRGFQPLRKVDDFLLWNLANYGAGIRIKNLDDYSIKIRVDSEL